jgi:polar amino acid transport system substrate-binding protein
MGMTKILFASGLVSLVIVAGLATTARTDTPKTAQAQIDEGKKLYVANCAKCHGDAGQGTKDAPPVVGKDAFPLDPRPKAKRDAKFHTAADVFTWASKNMPAKKPGTLKTEEMMAIFAFDLTANGIKLDKPLDAAAAQKIVLHP